SSPIADCAMSRSNARQPRRQGNTNPEGRQEMRNKSSNWATPVNTEKAAPTVGRKETRRATGQANADGARKPGTGPATTKRKKSFVL
ncbi:MAG: hypothetical protein ABWY07_00895, partial [Burkholderiales bacterium]